MSLAKRVIISAGHGGGDSGAVAQGTTEAKETIQITGRVVDLLKKDGRIAVVHVPDSLGLQDTIDWINARYKGLNDGISIDVHKNSGGGTGNEVWTPSYPDSKSKSMASKVANALAASTKLANRGVKYAQHNRWGRLGFCDDTNTYAMLIEAGFIDVDSNSSTLDAKFADGIYKGILGIYGLKPKAAPKPAPSVPKATRLSKALKLLAKSSPTNVIDIKTGKVVKVMRKGDPFDAYGKIVFGGKTYYVTRYSYDKDTRDGVLVTQLMNKPAPAPAPKPAPVVLTDTEEFKPARKMQLNRDAKLVTFPDGKEKAGSTTYKKDEVIEQVADRLTFSNGKKFYRTSYAAGSNAQYGFVMEDLRDYVEPKAPVPPAETDRSVLLKIQELIAKWLSKK